LTDLRTEDSGKLGCRLIGPEDQRFELLKDFAVTGTSTICDGKVVGYYIFYSLSTCP